MIKSLFAYNFQGTVKTEDAKNKTLSTSKHVIEHHKLQNTTILMKTLNASTEQVCGSITEGIHDVWFQIYQVNYGQINQHLF